MRESRASDVVIRYEDEPIKKDKNNENLNLPARRVNIVVQNVTVSGRVLAFIFGVLLQICFINLQFFDYIVELLPSSLLVLIIQPHIPFIIPLANLFFDYLLLRRLNRRLRFFLDFRLFRNARFLRRVFIPTFDDLLIIAKFLLFLPKFGLISILSEQLSLNGALLTLDLRCWRLHDLNRCLINYNPFVHVSCFLLACIFVLL